MSTLGRGQYPTLLSTGAWSSQYPSLARSPSSGDPCDSVFLDDATATPASPARYRHGDGGCHDDDLMETGGPLHHHHHPRPQPHLHHSLPRRHQGYQTPTAPGETPTLITRPPDY